MAVTINQTAFHNILTWAFCGEGTAPGGIYYTNVRQSCAITWCRVFSGAQPLNPSITTGITQVHSGNIALSSSTFLAPSGGVTRLSGPISFTSSVNAVTASFIRFYAGTSAPGAAIMDVPLSNVPGIGAAVITNTAMQTGVTFSVTDLRFGLNSIGQLSVNHAIQNFMLGMLTAKPAIGPSDAWAVHRLAAGSRYQLATDGASTYSATVPVRAYSGAIPVSANDAATGTLLWTKNLAVNDMFVVSGAGLSLVGPMQANASADGMPTYVRITKPAWATAGAGSGPECVIQAPVGAPMNGCLFSPPTMTSGVQANMTQFTVILEP